MRARAHYKSDMTSPGLNVRRATVDDLPALKTLWQNASLPTEDLESRLTEFYVVEAQGEFVGALGLQVLRQHAWLHSEDYTDFSHADAARELFWERLGKIAANLGVFRVWTQEGSPFWSRVGFHPANAETLTRLPEEWKAREGRWLTLELKNEEVISRALQDQFAGFMDGEKQQTARVADKARTLRRLLTLFFLAIFVLCLVVAFYLARRQGLIGR